jgi:hypothetical protein
VALAELQRPIDANHLTVTAPLRGRGIPNIPSPLGQPEPSVITNLGYDLRHTNNTQLSFESGCGRLQAALDEAVVRSAVSRADFLPIAQLPRLVYTTSVELELLRCQDSILRRFETRNFDWPASSKTVSREAQTICGQLHQSWRSRPEVEGDHDNARPEPQEKTYRKVFTILLMIGRPTRIRNFLEEGVCDADLPLEFPSKNCKPWDLRRKHARDVPLQLFKGWRPNTVKRFEKTQWTVLAPYLGQDERRKALFFKIPDRAILPFTNWEKVNSRGRGIGRGGYGQVYKTEIHSDHHGYEQDNEAEAGQPSLFAVKQLLHQREEDFIHELKILRAVSRMGHPHLITLFAAYEQQGFYHFIFPWAPLDLMSYWEDNTPSNDSDTARWLAEQCEGLSSGLATIHRILTRSGDSLLNMPVVEDPRPVTRNPPKLPQHDVAEHKPRVLICRHGDIKRENILWFPGKPGPDGIPSRGTLKLTDFGTAELMTDDKMKWSKPLTSPIYRPPEADLPLSDSFIRTSYDIWGLACVYLEFVAWCFGGWPKIEAFLQKRFMHDHKFYKFNTGTFFEVLPDDKGGHRARVKPGVYEVRHKTPAPHPPKPLLPFFD